MKTLSKSRVNKLVSSSSKDEVMSSPAVRGRCSRRSCPGFPCCFNHFTHINHLCFCPIFYSLFCNNIFIRPSSKPCFLLYFTSGFIQLSHLLFLSYYFPSPHIIFLSQSVLNAGSSGSGENDLSLCGSRICHEIAHSWFGLVIGAKDWTEEWISEGFATYLEDIIWAEARKVHSSCCYCVLVTAHRKPIRQYLFVC